VSQQSSYKIEACLTGASLILLTSLASAGARPLTAEMATNSASSIAADISSVGSYYASTSKSLSLSSNLMNSTAIYALLKIDAMEIDYPNLRANFLDARKFANSLPYDLAKPDIWTDEDSEVAFEWKGAGRHALASFEGNGSFGYAMRRGDRFVPGAFPGDLKNGIPRDLVNYLYGKTK
jgi:hypothetical protein